MSQAFFSRLEQFFARAPFLYRFLKRCKIAYQRCKYYLFKVTGEDRDIIYNEAFFDKNLEWNIPVASTIADILVSNYNPASVVDIGCGNAEFLAEFQKRNIFIQGYEGSQHAIDRAQVSQNLIDKIDLRNIIIAKRTYDLALCMEVAEHIERRFSRQLVENITQQSSTIIFTAAPPGQGGHFHLNEQPREYWIELFDEFGFGYDEVATKKISTEMKNRNVLWWYYQNLMIFRKK